MKRLRKKLMSTVCLGFLQMTAWNIRLASRFGWPSNFGQFAVFDHTV